MVLATFLTFCAGSESLMPACALLLVIYFMVWAVAGAQMLANWHDKRSRGQLPQGPAPGLGGEASSRLPSADPGGQLPPAGHDQRPAAEAAPIRRPRLLLPGWRALASLSYVR
jgi:hypothetical protein